MNQAPVSLYLVYVPFWEFLREPEMADRLNSAVYGLGGWMSLRPPVVLELGKRDSPS